MDHSIQLKVLYDSVLTQNLPVSRKTLGLKGKGMATFNDIQNFPLQVPPLTFPFRRGLARHARSAFDTAMKSPTSHAIATANVPSEEQWKLLWDYCKDQSPECSRLAYEL